MRAVGGRKAGHSCCSKMEFLEHGKEKPIVKVENLSNWEQMIRNGGIQKNLKSKTQSADSNLRPRCEGSAKQGICRHWNLASRLEMKLEIPRVGKRSLGGRNSATSNLVSKQTFEHP
ncbi:hypothetical protein AVEN_136695-1 [Araneus ventricosus]|uniref:Uncharacterized protein n=1 Tax=Araneus ventricosus TaxID=182803 RepID=A0A4Y2MFQ1_ARAVE|nr:hypothetical protein AVEN_136695-1 [Araneus ventricosus]